MSIAEPGGPPKRSAWRRRLRMRSSLSAREATQPTWRPSHSRGCISFPWASLRTAIQVFRGKFHVSEYLLQMLCRSEVDAVVKDEFRYQVRFEEWSEKNPEGSVGVSLQVVGFVVGVGFSFLVHGTALEEYATPVASIAMVVIVYGRYLEHRSHKAYAARGGLFPPEEEAPFIREGAPSWPRCPSAPCTGPRSAGRVYRQPAGNGSTSCPAQGDFERKGG